MPASLARILPALLLFATFLAHGCAKPIPRVHPEADLAWNRFIERHDPFPSGSGFSLRSNINYTAPERSHRVVVQIWGNPDYPVRADVKAGIGANLALLREDPLSSTAYFPQRNEALLTGPPVALRTPELTLPFTLLELSAMLTGSWEILLRDGYSSSSPVPGGWSFSLPDRRIDSLVIGFDGLLVSMSGSAGAKWTLQFQNWSVHAGREVPGRLVLDLDADERAVITLRELALVPGGWQEEALELRLPADARILHDRLQMEVP
jgi:hypothetical protein